MICFKFWEPVYFINWIDKSGKVLINLGSFFRFSWNVDDPMNFKVIHYNTDLRNRNMVVHRCVIVLRN